MRNGNEWELAHATACMAGGNVRHLAFDAKEYSVIEGVEYFLDMTDGPGHAASNHYWIKAEHEACEQDGFSVFLGGCMGNATVSWMGNGSAMLALRQGNLVTAMRLLFQGEANPWLTLKRQILKPLLTPGRRYLRRLRASDDFWQSYSGLNVQMARQLDIHGRMRAAGHDITLTPSPLRDNRTLFFEPEPGTSDSCWAEATAWHSVTRLDPTANFALLEYLLRVPDDQFYRKGRSSLLIQRAFQGRMPEPVLQQRKKGLQAADLGHRILRELPAFEECLASFEAEPTVREMLDLPRLHKCLTDLAVKVDPETTGRAGNILVRGMGVGLFLRRLVESGS
jgi:asparagine synthase (glutamine-hydrolysing)